jgi:hypothetical protein
MNEIGSPYLFTATNLRQLRDVKWYTRFPWRPQRSHPGDALYYHYTLTERKDKRMILQFGDGKDSANFLSTKYPIMVKTRLSSDVYQERYPSVDPLTRRHPPILGMYEIHRHYNDHFYETDQLWDDIPWSSKRNRLVWRGSSSGRRIDVVQQYIDHPSPNNIDVAFSSLLKIHQNKLPQPDEHYVRGSGELSVKEQLSYKYLLVLEGWGMASGLKWMLFSNSVVFMAPPTKTSWAMEETLVPYVHYVPLWSNYSNLPEQLEWATEHDEECYNISLYSRRYIERLVTSPQAQKDTLEILNGIDDIYQHNFGPLFLENCTKFE